MLRTCLDSILASRHESFEVVVIDQSERAADVPADPRLTYVHSATRGKSAGLNVGLSAVKAPIVAFTDDDCTVPDDWLIKAEALLDRHRDVVMAFGDLAADHHDPSEVFIPFTRHERFEIMKGVRSAAPIGGAGANLIARRSVFDTIGTWDESIGPGSRFRAAEEFDIYYRTIAAGGAVARDPDLVAIHYGARSYADGSGQDLLRTYAYGIGAVIGKHLRLGDLRMLAPASRIIGRDLAVVMQSFRHRRLAGLGPLAYKCRGIAAGLLRRVDRRRRVFAS